MSSLNQNENYKSNFLEKVRQSVDWHYNSLKNEYVWSKWIEGTIYRILCPKISKLESKLLKAETVIEYEDEDNLNTNILKRRTFILEKIETNGFEEIGENHPIIFRYRCEQYNSWNSYTQKTKKERRYFVEIKLLEEMPERLKFLNKKEK